MLYDCVALILLISMSDLYISIQRHVVLFLCRFCINNVNQDQSFLWSHPTHIKVFQKDMLITFDIIKNSEKQTIKRTVQYNHLLDVIMCLIQLPDSDGSPWLETIKSRNLKACVHLHGCVHMCGMRICVLMFYASLSVSECGQWFVAEIGLSKVFPCV